MRLAQAVLMDDDGVVVWEGPLRAFFRANAYSRAEASEIIEQLRPRADWPHCEPTTIGSGAASLFHLLLVEALLYSMKGRTKSPE